MIIVLIKLFLYSKLDLIQTVKFFKQLCGVQIQKGRKVLLSNPVKSRNWCLVFWTGFRVGGKTTCENVWSAYFHMFCTLSQEQWVKYFRWWEIQFWFIIRFNQKSHVLTLLRVNSFHWTSAMLLESILGRQIETNT